MAKPVSMRGFGWPDTTASRIAAYNNSHHGLWFLENTAEATSSSGAPCSHTVPTDHELENCTVVARPNHLSSVDGRVLKQEAHSFPRTNLSLDYLCATPPDIELDAATVPTTESHHIPLNHGNHEPPQHPRAALSLDESESEVSDFNNTPMEGNFNDLFAMFEKQTASWPFIVNETTPNVIVGEHGRGPSSCERPNQKRTRMKKSPKSCTSGQSKSPTSSSPPVRSPPRQLEIKLAAKSSGMRKYPKTPITRPSTISGKPESAAETAAVRSQLRKHLMQSVCITTGDVTGLSDKEKARQFSRASRARKKEYMRKLEDLVTQLQVEDEQKAKQIAQLKAQLQQL